MIRSMRRRACSSVKVSTARERSGRVRACSITRSVTRRSSASVLSTYSIDSVTGPRPFSTVTRRSCSGATGLGTATTSPTRARRCAKARSPSVAGWGSRRISWCGAMRSMSSRRLGTESPPYSSTSPTTTVCRARTIEGSAAAVGSRPPSATISTSKWRPRGITCGTRYGEASQAGRAAKRMSSYFAARSRMDTVEERASSAIAEREVSG